MPSKFMSTTIRLVLIIPLIGVWLMAIPERAEAHFCGRPPVSEKLRDADRVFMGEVTSVTRDEDRRLTLGKFTVSTVWKGPLDRTAHVYTFSGGIDSWGAPFEVGEDLLVYAYRNEYLEDRLFTDLCTSFRPLDLERYYPDELAELGEGQSPPPTIAERFLYGVIGLSLIGLSGMLWLGWRTRRARQR